MLHINELIVAQLNLFGRFFFNSNSFPSVDVNIERN